MALYLRPTTLDEALSAAASARFTVLAGGTDHFPVRADRVREEDILDLSALPDMRAIAAHDDHWFIPCGTTWTDLLRADLPGEFDALCRAARQVGGRQVQNAGTLVGNLCNASPAADGTPCLLALDAAVEIASLNGRRRVAVADFVTGPRKTALKPGEIVVGLRIPRQPGNPASVFLKLGARAYLVISIAAVAVSVWRADGRISQARVAVGACSPVPIRLPAAEAALLAGRAITSDDLACLAPIDDVRADAAYRSTAVLELLHRAAAEVDA
jgi:CO/xanthine dehydrogenase FAD-binding subunit